MKQSTRVFILDLRHSGERWARRFRLLDETESARREAFRSDIDRDRYTVAHVGLRLLLARFLGLSNDRLDFARRPCVRCGAAHGKPYLLGDHGLEWSMAHSADLVLYALSAQPVGIDVEETVVGSDLQMLHGTLHPLERAALAALPEVRRPDAFSQCWARKEALLKGLGVGLAAPPAERFVGLGARHAPARDRLDDWWLCDLAVPAGYAAALAVRGGEPSIPVPIRFDPIVAPDQDGLPGS